MNTLYEIILRNEKFTPSSEVFFQNFACSTASIGKISRKNKYKKKWIRNIAFIVLPNDKDTCVGTCTK